MFVLTVDQRPSRRGADRIGELVADLAHRPLLRKFDRTVGDEGQAVTDDPTLVVDIALELVRRGQWRIGIGIGPVDEPLPPTTRAGRGRAFEAARVAIKRAKNTPAGIGAAGDDESAAHDVEAIMTLLGVLVSRRTAEGHEAVDRMRGGRTQTDAAESLGITIQAMSQRLATAGWQAEGPGRTLAEDLLRTADGRPRGREPRP